MNGNQYIYDANFIIQALPIIILLVFLKKPQHFFCSIIFFNLLRLNERFAIAYSIPTISYPLILLCILLNFSYVRSYAFRKDDKVITAFVGLIIFQTLLFYRYNLKTVILISVLGLLYYLSIIIYLSDEKGVKLLLKTIILSLFLICFEPLYYHFSQPENSELWLRFHGVTSRLIAWGIFANSNETSFLSCFGIASLMIALSIVKLKKKYIILMIPIFITFMLDIFLSASRAGMFSLFLIFFGFVLFVKKKSIRILAIAIALLAIAVAPKFITERTDQESSSSERFDLRWEGRQLFLQNPIFGIGFLRAPEETGGMALHNTFIQAFAELGILGGGFFLYYFFLLFLDFKKLFSQVISSIRMRSTYAITIGFFLSTLFYFYFGNQLLSIMFFTIMAFIRTIYSRMNNLAITSNIS